MHKIENSDIIFSYTKRNGIAYLAIPYIQGHASGLVAISTKVPEGYRPVEGFEPYFPIGYEDNRGKCGLCKIYNDGTIKTITPDNQGYYAATISYPVE